MIAKKRSSIVSTENRLHLIQEHDESSRTQSHFNSRGLLNDSESGSLIQQSNYLLSPTSQRSDSPKEFVRKASLDIQPFSVDMIDDDRDDDNDSFLSGSNQRNNDMLLRSSSDDLDSPAYNFKK